MAFERYRIVTGDDSLEADCGLDGTRRNGAAVDVAWAITTGTASGISTASPGPDEYTAVVRDNVFTNLMAAHNLRDRGRGVSIDIPTRPARWG